MLVQLQQPRFGGDAAIITANLIRQLREQNKQERLAKQSEAQIRQQVFQELQAAGCLNTPLPARDTFQLSSKPAPILPPKNPIHFGMALGESVWNSATGKKNEYGLSTTVSNCDPSESWDDVGRTQKEKDYLKVKREWQAAKADSSTSQEDKDRLKAKKQELKPGAKASKKKAERVNTVLSLGTGAIPGPIGTVSGFATKPVAATLVNLTESSDTPKSKSSKTSSSATYETSQRGYGSVKSGGAVEAGCVVQ